MPFPKCNEGAKLIAQCYQLLAVQGLFAKVKRVAHEAEEP